MKLMYSRYRLITPTPATHVTGSHQSAIQSQGLRLLNCTFKKIAFFQSIILFCFLSTENFCGELYWIALCIARFDNFTILRTVALQIRPFDIFLQPGFSGFHFKATLAAEITGNNQHEALCRTLGRLSVSLEQQSSGCRSSVCILIIKMITW